MAAQGDTSLKIYDALHSTLKTSGFSEESSRKYATFAVEMYDYIRDRPALQEALKAAKEGYKTGTKAYEYSKVARLANNASEMGLSAAGKLGAKATVAAGAPISAFVDCFAALAKALKIEINDCAIAVTKVMLDVLAVLALASTVVTAWVAAVQCFTTVTDTQSMMQACFG